MKLWQGHYWERPRGVSIAGGEGNRRATRREGEVRGAARSTVVATRASVIAPWICLLFGRGESVWSRGSSASGRLVVIHGR
jgi:hypothetical protein